MKISTSLNVYDSCKSYEEGMLRATQCGFECYDLNCKFPELELDNYKERYTEIKKYADSLGVEFYQSHTHIVVGEYNDYQIELMKRSIDATAIVDAKWAVIHPIQLKDTALDERIEENIKFLSPFIEYAKNLGVGIAVENMPAKRFWYGETLNDYSFDSAEGLSKLCDILNDKFGNVGICWDTGHANLSDGNQYDSIKLMGDRLKVLHIADNYDQYDDHMPPFYGNIDFNAIMKALKEINYSGTFNFETHKFTSNLPDELIDDAVRFMYKIGKYLCDKAL